MRLSLPKGLTGLGALFHGTRSGVCKCLCINAPHRAPSLRFLLLVKSLLLSLLLCLGNPPTSSVPFPFSPPFYLTLHVPAQAGKTSLKVLEEPLSTGWGGRRGRLPLYPGPAQHSETRPAQLPSACWDLPCARCSGRSGGQSRWEVEVEGPTCCPT